MNRTVVVTGGNRGKAGLLMATKNMAYKLGPYGIRVNSVTPGGIETDMSRHVWQDPGFCRK